MKFLPDTVARKVARQVLVGRKHSPTILFVGGVAGVITSTVLACRATLKLEEVLAETQENIETAQTLQHDNYSEDDRKKDLAYLQIRNVVSITKLYAPAVIVGVVSISALVGSHQILTKRNAALTAAYAALEKGFKDYRKRVIDAIGEEKEEKLYYPRKEIEDVDESGKKTKVNHATEHTASIYARFFDEYNRNWNRNPEYNMAFLKAQQNYANDMLLARGHVFLNEVYDSLGMERTTAGAVVGWVVSKDGDNYIDFGIFNGKNERARVFVNGGEPSILLDFNVDGVIYDKI